MLIHDGPAPLGDMERDYFLSVPLGFNVNT